MKEYFLWLAKLVTILVIVFLGIPLLLATAVSVSQQQIATGEAAFGQSKDAIAVLEVNGVIEDSKKFLKELRKQVKNDRIKGVVVRINSPGGAVGPSQDIYEAIRLLKSEKPIIASMGSVAASGGLYVAMSASKVFAQPGTLTGSIGVIMQFPNLTKIAEQVGFNMVTIKSGEFKDVANMFRDQRPEDLAILQSTVDDVRRQFVQAIADGRAMDVGAVESFADGRVFSGSEAKALGLVDSFGGVVEAARAVFTELGEELPPEQLPNLYYPENKFEELSQYFEACVKRIAMLIGATPRAITMRYQWVL